jgi:hypothetical protein
LIFVARAYETVENGDDETGDSGVKSRQRVGMPRLRIYRELSRDARYRVMPGKSK